MENNILSPWKDKALFTPGLLTAGRTVKQAILRAAGGHAIRLAIRPEELNTGYLEGANNLTGKVDAITYLGSIIRIRVDIEVQLISMDMFNERKLQIPAVGDLFQVNFDADACWLL